jgi:hypothetical protein
MDVQSAGGIRFCRRLCGWKRRSVLTDSTACIELSEGSNCRSRGAKKMFWRSLPPEGDVIHRPRDMYAKWSQHPCSCQLEPVYCERSRSDQFICARFAKLSRDSRPGTTA